MICEPLLLPGVHREPPLGDAGTCQLPAPSGSPGSAVGKKIQLLLVSIF